MDYIKTAVLDCHLQAWLFSYHLLPKLSILLGGVFLYSSIVKIHDWACLGYGKVDKGTEQVRGGIAQLILLMTILTQLLHMAYYKEGW